MKRPDGLSVSIVQGSIPDHTVSVIPHARFLPRAWRVLKTRIPSPGLRRRIAALKSWGVGPSLGAVICAFAFGDLQLAAQDLLTPEERQWVQQHGPIRYAPHREAPPFETIQPDGSVQGLAPDILSRMAANLGVQVEPVEFPTWVDAIQGVGEGRADFLAVIRPTPERREYLQFTTPYLEVQNVIFVNSTGSGIAGTNDLAGRRVAVVRNYAEHEWIHMSRSPLDRSKSRSGVRMVRCAQPG